MVAAAAPKIDAGNLVARVITPMTNASGPMVGAAVLTINVGGLVTENIVLTTNVGSLVIRYIALMVVVGC